MWGFGGLAEFPSFCGVDIIYILGGLWVSEFWMDLVLRCVPGLWVLDSIGVVCTFYRLVLLGGVLVGWFLVRCLLW